MFIYEEGFYDFILEREQTAIELCTSLTKIKSLTTRTIVLILYCYLFSRTV